MLQKISFPVASYIHLKNLMAIRPLTLKLLPSDMRSASQWKLLFPTPATMYSILSRLILPLYVRLSVVGQMFIHVTTEIHSHVLLHVSNCVCHTHFRLSPVATYKIAVYIVFPCLSFSKLYST